MYLEPPCACDGCSPYGARMPCKYDAHDSDVKSLYGFFITYVEAGKTPLLSLPYWVAEVAELVGHFRVQRETRAIQDKREQAIQREMMKAAGLLR